MKKHICIFLMFCMVWGMLPIGSMAEELGESLQSVVGVGKTTEVVYMPTGTPPTSSGGSPGGGGGYTTSVPAPTPTPTPTPTFIPTMPPSTGGSGGGVIITPTIVPNPTSPPSSGGGGGGSVIPSPVSDFLYTEQYGQITITGYVGSGGDVVIPSEIDGKPVTGIGELAFSNINYISHVVMPNSITSIESYAFYSCSGLRQIVISSSVTSIGNAVLVGCSNLTEIQVDENNQVYSSIEGVLFNKEGSTLIYYPYGKIGEYVIPDGTTTITQQAFAGRFNLTGVVVPESITTIGNYAFGSCLGLENVVLLGNPTILGESVFEKCSALKSVVLKDGLTNIGNCMFYDCTGLTYITIPSSVTSISAGAFYNCNNLREVYFLGNAPTVGSSAFYKVYYNEIYYLPTATGFTSPTWQDMYTALYYNITSLTLNNPTNLFQTYGEMQEVKFEITTNPREINPYAIEWYVNGIKQSNVGKSFSFTPTEAGEYVVSVKAADNENAVGDSKTIRVTGEQSKAKLYVANPEARIGGEAKVPIEISADTQMAVGSFIIQYNNEHLTPVSYTIGDVISNASPLVNLNYTDPKTGKKAIKVSWMSLSSLNSGGNLIIIEFHVNDSAEDNITIPLTLSDVILADTNAEVIPYEVKNGGITAFDMLSGDVNNDGNINIIDALIVLCYDAGKAGLTDAQLSAADVNKDGAVDIYDAMLVQRYDLGLGGWLD